MVSLNTPWLHLVSYSKFIADVTPSYFFKECQHLRAVTYWQFNVILGLI